MHKSYHARGAKGKAYGEFVITIADSSHPSQYIKLILCI
jgi:hypothetical protein